MNEHPARVGDQVQHSRSFQMGVLCAIAGGAALLLFVFPPTAIVAVAGAALAGETVEAGLTFALVAGMDGGLGTLEGVSAIAAGIGGGDKVGELIGAHMSRKAGDILDGSNTVAIGVGQPKAARIKDPLKCHPGKVIATGSATVFFDERVLNCARRLDYTECGGQIIEGCPTVLVGGASVALHDAEIKETAGLLYTLTFLAVDVGGGWAGLKGIEWGASALENASGASGLGGLLIDGYKIAGGPGAEAVDVFGGTVGRTLGSANDLSKGVDGLGAAKVGADTVGSTASVGNYVGEPENPNPISGIQHY